MNAVFTSLVDWFCHFSAAAAVALAGLLAARGLIRSPALRVQCTWGCWLGLLLLAVLLAVPNRPQWELAPRWLLAAQHSETAPRPSAALPRVGSEEIVVGVLPGDTQPRHVSLPPAKARWSAWTAWPVDWPWQLVTGIWLAVAVAIGVQTALGWLGARRLIRNSQAAPAWAVQELAQIAGRGRQTPELRTSLHVCTALAVGARHPRIVLPLSAVEASNRAGVRAALAHEWAHIRRGDLWLLLCERMLAPLLALQPLFWWLRRSVRLDQELLADAEAAGNEPVAYAEALLGWARQAGKGPRQIAALAIWEESSPISRRIQMVLKSDGRPERCGFTWTALAWLMPVALVAGLSFLSLDSSVAHENQVVQTATDPTGAADGRATLPVLAESGPEQIQLSVQVFRVDCAEAFQNGTTLQELVIQVSDGVQLRREGGLLTADLAAKLVPRVLERLQKTKGVSVLAAPRVLTLSGREARIRVGSDEPVLATVETVNGKRTARVETRPVGTDLLVLPSLEGDSVVLQLAAEQLSLNPPQDERSIPSIDKHKLVLQAKVQSGNALLLAEAPNQNSPREQMLYLIRPEKLSRELVVAAAKLADLQAAQTTGQSELSKTDAAAQIRELQTVVAQLRLELGSMKSASCIKCHAAGRPPHGGEEPCPAIPTKQPAVAVLPTAPAAATSPNRSILLELRQLDVRAVELDFAAAREEYDEARQLFERSELSAAQLRAKKFAVERAQIELERAKLQFEELREQLSAAQSGAR